MASKRYTQIQKNQKKDSLFLKFIKFIFKLVLSILLICLFLGFAILTFEFFYVGEVEDGNFWQSQNTMYIYDRDGNLMTTYGLNVDYVTLDEVSENFTNALIATEDSKFEKHHGVDYIGMIRAVYQTLFTSSSSGGSTLTMQLAKLLYLQGENKVDGDGNIVYDDNGNPVKTYSFHNKIEYKLQQIAYAWKVEGKYNKNEILENYVNFISLGVPSSDSRGIESAANYYFGVTAANLSLSQGAVLAGMVQEPNGDNNPYVDITGATKRRNTVLDRMKTEGYITNEECDKAKAEKIQDTLVKHDSSEEIDSSEVIRSYLDVVDLELKDLFGEDFNPVEANMSVYTNLDYDLQEDTYKIINNYDGNIRYPDDYMQAGSATIDSQTGEILAIGGGRTTNGPIDQNYGALYQRQPGSTSKPIVDYAPAIEFLDWSTYHQLNDKYTYYTGSKEGVKNADGVYAGQMSIQQGLAASKNTIALQTFQATTEAVGIDTVKDFIAGLGITDLDDFNEAYSIGGWNNGTTPLELSGAYATLANGGVYNKPHAINKIKFSKSSPYYEEYGDEYVYDYETHTAMEAQTAYMVTKMLNPDLYYALTNNSGLKVSGLGEQAIKTGTSNWGEAAEQYGIPEGGPRDKWVAGYSGDVTTVIWSGYDGEDEAKGYYFDSYGFWSYDIYAEIMEAVVDNSAEYLHNDSIEVPKGVATRKVGGATYYYKTNSSDYSEQKEEEKEEKEKEEKEQAEKEEAAKKADEAEKEATKEDEKDTESDEVEEITLGE
ncbi:MAG: transglycosylase domain-containing protein [Mycoplasmatales bacterium]